MSKKSHYDRTKNRVRKHNNYAVLMAMCVIAGIGSIVIGSMYNDPAAFAIGTASAGIAGVGTVGAYNGYKSLHPSSKRGGRTDRP